MCFAVALKPKPTLKVADQLLSNGEPAECRERSLPLESIQQDGHPFLETRTSEVVVAHSSTRRTQQIVGAEGGPMGANRVGCRAKAV